MSVYSASRPMLTSSVLLVAAVLVDVFGGRRGYEEDCVISDIGSLVVNCSERGVLPLQRLRDIYRPFHL